MTELIYNKLENRIGEMHLPSQKETVEAMSPEAKKYFNGFGDEIIDIKKLASGVDSSIFMVKLKEFENRTQLVKVYDGLKSVLRDKKDQVPVLNKYFQICNEVRDFLKTDNNPLKQRIIINGKEFSPELSIAQMGILVKKNGEVGSWIREWVPGKNMSEGKEDTQHMIDVSSYVFRTFRFLSEKFGYNIDAGDVNYKIILDEKSKIIKIVITDLTDFIPRFIKEL